MIKRTIVAYSLMAIFLVALIATNVYFYLENNNLRSLLRQDCLREMSEKAGDVWSRVSSFMGWYDDCMWRLQGDLEQDFSNETKERLIWTTAYLLDCYSDGVAIDVERDFNRLRRLDEEFYEIYNNVSDTVEYALAQVDWTMLGRADANERVTLLWELYYLLGVDQISRLENFSALRGIAYSFNRLWSYWDREYYFLLTNGRITMPSYLTKPEVALEWALGNATALYQELTEWHERTKPTLP